jgi:hypothetical protein
MNVNVPLVTEFVDVWRQSLLVKTSKSLADPNSFAQMKLPGTSPGS